MVDGGCGGVWGCGGDPPRRRRRARSRQTAPPRPAGPEGALSTPLPSLRAPGWGEPGACVQAESGPAGPGVQGGHGDPQARPPIAPASNGPRLRSVGRRPRTPGARLPAPGYGGRRGPIPTPLALRRPALCPPRSPVGHAARPEPRRRGVGGAGGLQGRSEPLSVAPRAAAPAEASSRPGLAGAAAAAARAPPGAVPLPSGAAPPWSPDLPRPRRPAARRGPRPSPSLRRAARRAVPPPLKAAAPAARGLGPGAPPSSGCGLGGQRERGGASRPGGLGPALLSLRPLGRGCRPGRERQAGDLRLWALSVLNVFSGARKLGRRDACRCSEGGGGTLSRRRTGPGRGHLQRSRLGGVFSFAGVLGVLLSPGRGRR